jgi:cytochrome P450
VTADSKYTFDPSDPTKAKDPAFLARIRRDRGVVRTDEGLVVSTRFSDTSMAFRDNKKLSSAGDMRAPGVVVAEGESFLGELDPPIHPKIRRILVRSFTPQGANDAEDWTRQEVRRRFDSLDTAQRGDLMDDLAIPLPGSVSAHVLGIPDELHDQMMIWCNEVLHSSWIPTGRTDRGEGIENSFPELSSVVDDLMSARRGKDPDGWRISDDHVRTLTINILAGSLSASYLLGNLLYRYVTNVEGFASTLEKDRSMVTAAVAESLRLEAPVQFMFRHATADLEIGGCPVSRGSHVLLSIAAANRDESVYPDADSFRLDRGEDVEHLSYGVGPHLCLGNHLTNMIGKVILEEVIDRYPQDWIHLAPGFEWVCVDHMLEFGPEHLPIVMGELKEPS